MAKIAVIGSINMDMTAESERIPRPGETLMGRDLRYCPGGKGANQAVAAARLGGDVTMFGCVGKDDMGDRLLENLRQQGVRTDYILRTGEAHTGLAMITVAESDNAILVIPGANRLVTPAYLEGCREQILDCRVIVLQNEIPMETVEHAVRMCKEDLSAPRTIVYNPAPAAPISDELFELADFLTPNEHEAAAMFPELAEFTPAAVNDFLTAHPGKVVITLGGEGVTASLSEEEVLLVPSKQVPVVDTTGAGDTFNGAFAYSLANGKNLKEAMTFANAAAAISVQYSGAQDGMPRLSQVEELLR